MYIGVGGVGGAAGHWNRAAVVAVACTLVKPHIVWVRVKKAHLRRVTLSVSIVLCNGERGSEAIRFPPLCPFVMLNEYS